MKLCYSIGHFNFLKLIDELNKESNIKLEGSIRFSLERVWLDESCGFVWDTIIAKENGISWQFLTPVEQKLLVKINKSNELNTAEYIAKKFIQLHSSSSDRAQYRAMLQSHYEVIS